MRPVALSRLLAELRVVVGLDRSPVDKHREHPIGFILGAAKLGRSLFGAQAPFLLHKPEHVGQTLVRLAFHAADARIAAQKYRCDADLRAIAAALAEQLEAAGHAEIELGHAHAAHAGSKEMPALMDEDKE